MMLARVADSLYWIGRYIERAEHLSRLSDVMLTATLDQNEAAVAVAPPAVLAGVAGGAPALVVDPAASAVLAAAPDWAGLLVAAGAAD